MSPARLNRRNIRTRHLLALLALLGLITALATPANAQTGHFTRSQASRAVASAPSLAAHLPKSELPRVVKVVHRHRGPAAPGRSVAPDLSSSNWSGYVDRACSTCQIRYVQANFNPQEINCSGVADDAHEVYEWVGLNGVGDSTIQQIGWASYCEGTAVHSFLWYENFPQNPIQITSIQGWHTGDEYTAEAYYQSSNNSYYLTLDDVTLNKSFTTPALACPTSGQCKNSSAEVIAEDPGYGGPADGHLLANFGHFDPYSATVTSLNGTHGNMGTEPYWSSEEWIMQYPGTTLMAEPDALYNVGNDSNFDVAYHSDGS